MKPYIELRNIRNKFPGVVANDDVSISLIKGEIRAIAGENGAGKSTLMKTLYGMQYPIKGEVVIDGQLQHLRSPQDAIKKGIGMIHQHFMLVSSLTALENIILGVSPRKQIVFIDYEAARSKIESLIQQYNLSVPLDVKVRDLAVGDCQRIEILKALYRDVDVLILDEPTAILTPQETEGLFRIMKEFATAGKIIVFITHKLREVKAVADNITVMRKGKLVGSMPVPEVTEHDIARMMVGRKVLFEVGKKPSAPGNAVLEVHKLEVQNRRNLPAVRGINFKVSANEIVGIAGVEGNGQHELIECLSGMWPSHSGSVTYNGKDITHATVYQRREAGIAHIPEDRLKTGLCAEISLWENLLMGYHKNPPFIWLKGLMLNHKYIARFSTELIEKFNIKVPDFTYLLKTLSGGNLQKTVLAREISHVPKLLIVSQPTRGVDMGAIEFIHKEIVAMRDQGCAILVVSADLQELMNLTDRILVIYDGEIVGETVSGAYNEHQIGYWMAGLHGEEVA